MTDNLEKKAGMKERINSIGEGMICLIMGGFGAAGTKIGAEILGKTSSSSNPIVVYGDGSLAAAATLGCSALAVYCGLEAVKRFKEATKYNKPVYCAGREEK